MGYVGAVQKFYRYTSLILSPILRSQWKMKWNMTWKLICRDYGLWNGKPHGKGIANWDYTTSYRGFFIWPGSHHLATDSFAVGFFHTSAIEPSTPVAEFHKTVVAFDVIVQSEAFCTGPYQQWCRTNPSRWRSAPALANLGC